MSDIRKKYNIADFEIQVGKILAKVNAKKVHPLILIQGGYGKNNLGDDALLLVLHKKILKFSPNAHIIVLCHYAETVKKNYDINAVNFKSVDTLKLLFQCDALIIGGGGIVNIINTYSGNHFFKMFDMKGKFLFLSSLLVKSRKKPVIFYGVGMTSIPDMGVKLLMKLTLKKIDIISVRDETTWANLKNMKLITDTTYLTHDPALDFDEEPSSAQKEQLDTLIPNQCIIISLRAVINEKINQNVCSCIENLIYYLSEKYSSYKIILLPVSIHPQKKIENDFFISKNIYNKIKNHNNIILMKKYYSPAEIKYLFSKADVIIMARLHGLILSYDFHIPTIVLAYDTKVEQFARMGNYKYIFHYNALKLNELKETINKILDKNGE